jgi:transposase
MWRTYMTLTNLEAVFRRLKSELGLCPIYHHKEVRSDGHLFITVLAYHMVQFIHHWLKDEAFKELEIALVLLRGKPLCSLIRKF